MQPHLIITGNPCDGFTHIGPFHDRDEAVKWTEQNHMDADWWVIPLEDPDFYASQARAA